MISVKQLNYLTVIVIFSTGILYLPSIAISQAGNGGWISPFMSMSVGMIVLFIVFFFYHRFAPKTLTEYLPLLVGKWGAKILGLLYVFFFWTVGLKVIREITGIVRITLLPNTPLIVICFMIALTVIYGVYCGIEALARLVELLALILPAMIIALMAGLMGFIHWDAFLPLMEFGWQGVIRGAFMPSSWFGEVIVLAYLLPIVTMNKSSLPRFLLSLVVTAFLLSSLVILIIGVLGVSEAARIQLTVYELMRYVQFGAFLQHIDALFLLPWLMFMFLKALLFFHVTVIGFSQSMGLVHSQFTIIPFVLLSMVFSHWIFPDEFTLNQFLKIIWPNYALFFELVIPIVLLLLYWTRRHKIQSMSLT